MKKVLIGISLGLVLGMIVLTNLVSAQVAKPNECCIVTHLLDPIPPDTNNAIGNSTHGDLIVPISGIYTCTLETPTLGKEIALNNWSMYCLLNSIYTVTDWVFYILITIVVIMMVWGGLFYVTAAGDPEKAGKGKQIIVYAIVGLIIALLARLAPAVIRFVMGV